MLNSTQLLNEFDEANELMNDDDKRVNEDDDDNQSIKTQVFRVTQEKRVRTQFQRQVLRIHRPDLRLARLQNRISKRMLMETQNSLKRMTIVEFLRSVMRMERR